MEWAQRAGNEEQQEAAPPEAPIEAAHSKLEEGVGLTSVHARGLADAPVARHPCGAHRRQIIDGFRCPRSAPERAAERGLDLG